MQANKELDGLMRTQDDGQRGSVALCLSIRRDGPDIEVTMDDVVLDTDRAEAAHWHLDTFVTFARISAAKMNGEMSEEDYARFGRLVFGSLSALAKFRLPEKG